MKVIGQFSGNVLTKLWDWVRSQNLDNCVRSRYAPQRLERWYGFGSNLQSLKNGRAKIFPAERPSNPIIQLGDELYPGWHSLLVCGGKTDIGWHFDHGHFTKEAVMVNLGESIYSECSAFNGYKPIEWTEHKITDGMVVEIDIKRLHCAQQISATRFNLTWRKFKPEYLEQLQF
ncbi:MAG: hypothetical protein F6K36_22910 [Symploca sp. SIO3C6]|uniref:Uncharacterized protein n=1 Tax=Symploca sp. SIO1C4 TaxID=2607765 RepID=A0A6B3NI02_9CYAN|nr:hypothetical protein [Symploca sp. SIO3C6]NER31330.1 hypothetical protein [Symploca sp. SIO1C4]